MDVLRVLVKPILTEKSLLMAKEQNIYSFLVNPKANKTEIKEAVWHAFKVNVERVNVLKLVRRKVRYGKSEGLRPARKKAYVKIKTGQKIPIFETG